MFNRSRKRWLTLGLVIALVLVVAMSCAPTPAPPAPTPVTPAPTPVTPAPTPVTPAPPAQRILMGSTKASSSFYVFAVAWARVMNKYVEGLDVTVVETTASIENLQRMENDEFALQMWGNPDTLYQVNQGIGIWEGKEPLVKCRDLFAFGSSPITWLARADRGITSMEDLAGKKISAGPVGSSTQRIAAALMEILGIDCIWYESDWAEAVLAVKDRRIDAMVKGCPITGLDASVLDIVSVTDTVILPFTEEQKAQVGEVLPYIPWMLVPAGHWAEFPDMPAYLAWNFPQITGASATMISEEMGYQIMKASVEHADEFNWPAYDLEVIDPVQSTLDMLGGMALTPWLHLGAIKYYREIGIDIPDRLIPPEGK